MNKMRLTIVKAFCLFLLFGLLWVRDVVSQEVGFDMVRAGIIHIGEQIDGADPKWLGTGFLVDDACTFATAKHVLISANKDKLVIRFQRPQDRRIVLTHPVRVLYEEPDVDLAFLRIDKLQNKPCRSGGLYVLKLPESSPTSSVVGKSVTIVGHPRLADQGTIDIPVLRKGHVSSVEIAMGEKPALLLDLTGVPGFSGSPVFLDATGEVIAVVYGPGPTRREFGFEWATIITRKHYDNATKVKPE